MVGFGDDNPDGRQFGMTLRAKRQHPVHQYLLKKYNEPELLKGLHKMAQGERYLLKKPALAELTYLKIFNEDGTMPKDVAGIVLESIIVEEDGNVVLELG